MFRRVGRKGGEKEYYEVVKEKLAQLFRERGVNVYLEITASGVFSNRIKSEIPHDREIIFSFLRKVAPDITGFVERSGSSEFVVVEVKRNEIGLDDIYQLRKYADLFDAKFSFLVSLKPVPEEIKRLSKAVYAILARPSIYHVFVLTYFDGKSGEFVEWFEENPFTKSIYWR